MVVTFNAGLMSMRNLDELSPLSRTTVLLSEALEPAESAASFEYLIGQQWSTVPSIAKFPFMNECYCVTMKP